MHMKIVYTTKSIEFTFPVDINYVAKLSILLVHVHSVDLLIIYNLPLVNSG